MKNSPKNNVNKQFEFHHMKHCKTETKYKQRLNSKHCKKKIKKKCMS
jgi:hypothetical protein